MKRGLVCEILTIARCTFCQFLGLGFARRRLLVVCVQRSTRLPLGPLCRINCGLFCLHCQLAKVAAKVRAPGPPALRMAGC